MSQRQDKLFTRNMTSFVNFIYEREAICVRRANGSPPPWTDDPILRVWSFTNVRRECDRVTQWIAKNWRTPHADDPDLFFAMAVARLVNWPDTMAELGYPVPWQRNHFVATLQAQAERGVKVWGSAYNVSNAGSTRPKVDVVASRLDPLWSRRKQLRPRPEDSLLAFYVRLRDMDGFGSFMAAQVVADVKQVEPLRSARDWWTFAAPGPGSKRGLNRVIGRPKDTPWRDDDAWRAALGKLHKAIAPELERLGIGRICAQDLQNCLCEFDKFERVRLGEGKPKRKFVPRLELKEASLNS